MDQRSPAPPRKSAGPCRRYQRNQGIRSPVMFSAVLIDPYFCSLKQGRSAFVGARHHRWRTPFKSRPRAPHEGVKAPPDPFYNDPVSRIYFVEQRSSSRFFDRLPVYHEQRLSRAGFFGGGCLWAR